MTKPKPTKLCTGCRSNLLLENMTDSGRRYNTYECKFTPSEIKRIPRCPCTNCLVKVTCFNLCYKLEKICKEKYPTDKTYIEVKEGDEK
jgi:hypothetical protein